MGTCEESREVDAAGCAPAVNEGSPFSMHNRPPNTLCPICRNIQKALRPIYGQAERVMEEYLSRSIILSLLHSVQRREQA
jgi:hypothetical protein